MSPAKLVGLFLEMDRDREEVDRVDEDVFVSFSFWVEELDDLFFDLSLSGREAEFDLFERRFRLSVGIFCPTLKSFVRSQSQLRCSFSSLTIGSGCSESSKGSRRGSWKIYGGNVMR